MSAWSASTATINTNNQALRMRIFAQRLFDGEAFTGPSTLEITAGRITAIIPGEATPDLRLEHGVLGPGLIDLHNNGAFGVDCASATPAQWTQFVEGLAACGVTSVLPTFITAPLTDIASAAARLRAAMHIHPGLLGLHLEGPFLSPAKRGAHRLDWLRLPDQATLEELLGGPAGDVLRVVTLAPELPHALSAIQRLTRAGIHVSLGHTDANATQMREAVGAGARLVTHIFNAQSALGHRAIGAPGVGLSETLLSPCAIVDGVHVDPALLHIIFAACPRAIAVTDSIALAGLPTGTRLDFGGEPAILAPNNVGQREDGTLAGAAITLDEGVRRLIRYGIAPAIALASATSRPAAALGLACGRISPGAVADLVWWSNEYHALQVWRAGRAAEPRPPRGTESPRLELMDLETRSTEDIVGLFLQQEDAALTALRSTIPSLTRLIEAVAQRLAQGGRLFYAGAGTAGRLGFLDAVECRPTFGVEPGLIIPLLAGGANAFIQAAEGAEDDPESAPTALEQHHFCAKDVLVGIAASGHTPFTLSALRHAASLGGLTGAIVNNPGSLIAKQADIAVELCSGAEIIAGSTRLSAGTSEKIALNILSSVVMIRLGRTYGPFMVDMRASNNKLRRRAVRMVMAITNTQEPQAQAALQNANGQVKLAVLMLKTGLSLEAAQTCLNNAAHSLRRALAASAPP